MNFVNLLFRLFYWCEMIAVEIQMDGYNKVLDETRDIDLYFEVMRAKNATSRELAAIRMKYNSTFKPGVRFTWKNG